MKHLETSFKPSHNYLFDPLMTFMETFEIHITGATKAINTQLDRLGIKNIIIDLLKPNYRVLRTEFMSSFVTKHNNLDDCKRYVDSVIANLSCEIIRVKIESPYYEHYKEQSLYLEAHFKPFNTNYPIARNIKSFKELATDRTYDKDEYEAFQNKWIKEDVEMCLVDSFIEEDKDWFDLYLVESN